MRAARRLLPILVAVPLVLSGNAPAYAVTAVEVTMSGSGWFAGTPTGLTPPSGFGMTATGVGLFGAGVNNDIASVTCNLGGSATTAGAVCHGTGQFGWVYLSCDFTTLWLVAASHWTGSCSITVSGALGSSSGTASVAAEWVIVPTTFPATTFVATGAMWAVPTP